VHRRQDTAGSGRDEAAILGADPSSGPLSLAEEIAERIDADGGWWPFDRFMAAALYTPGRGYYAGGRTILGLGPEDGSDFVTAPELSPAFGHTLGQQGVHALRATTTDTVLELGAGTGALAEQVLVTAGETIRRYDILDLSGSLQARQRQRLARFGDRVRWLERWPEAIEGVVLGNEVLDAMPVQLLHWDGRQWFERGVAVDTAGSGLVWHDRPTALRPPVEAPDAHFAPGSTVEIQPQVQAFVATLAARLKRGVAIFIDYGFPQSEYYLPQRSEGTLMCHRGHRADADPLADVGAKDITAHVDFSALALAAQDAGLEVLGYTSQARFLLNAGILERLHGAAPATIAGVQRLLAEHEMGEIFKVIAFGRGVPAGWTLPGLVLGDRSHTL
jgi:SAM-dependent MidA family methyltransferase